MASKFAIFAFFKIDLGLWVPAQSRAGKPARHVCWAGGLPRPCARLAAGHSGAPTPALPLAYHLSRNVPRSGLLVLQGDSTREHDAF